MRSMPVRIVLISVALLFGAQTPAQDLEEFARSALP